MQHDLQHATCNGTQALGHNFAHTLLDDCYAVFYTAQQLGLGTIPCVPNPCRMGYRAARHSPLHCALDTPRTPHAFGRSAPRIHPRALLAFFPPLIALSRSGELRPVRSSARHGMACRSVWLGLVCLFVCLFVRRFLCWMRCLRTSACYWVLQAGLPAGAVRQAVLNGGGHTAKQQVTRHHDAKQRPPMQPNPYFAKL
jgi:hypothetical protein